MTLEVDQTLTNSPNPADNPAQTGDSTASPAAQGNQTPGGDTPPQPAPTGEGQTLAQAQAKPNRTKEYVRRQTAARYAAERRAEQAEAAYRALAAKTNEDRAKRQPSQDPATIVRDIAHDAVTEGRADALRQTAQAAREEARNIAVQTWAEAEQEARAKYPDYDAVAHNGSLPISDAMADALTEMPEGADIAYYLGKNPAKAAEIYGLPARSQAAALTRLITELPSTRAAVQATTSAAPPPVRALSGSQGSSASKDPNSMTTDEYAEWRSKGGGR